jgi:hypothetical protein
MLAGARDLLERQVALVPVVDVVENILGFLVVQRRHVLAELVGEINQVGGETMRPVVHRFVMMGGAIDQQLRQPPVLHQRFADSCMGNPDLLQLCAQDIDPFLDHEFLGRQHALGKLYY